MTNGRPAVINGRPATTDGHFVSKNRPGASESGPIALLRVRRVETGGPIARADAAPARIQGELDRAGRRSR